MRPIAQQKSTTLGANHIQKIAIVGPESTGKTTLASQLAQALHTVWIPEYAREFLEQLGRPYVREDLIDIAKGQLALENQGLPQANKWLICDTNLLVIKIWEEFRYGAQHPDIGERMNLSTFALYILTKTDIPWTADDQRESPDLAERQELFSLYEQALLQAGVSYITVSGTPDMRLDRALRAIGELGNGE
ncbi:MAG: ATP-binding protein [Bacteroidota bacterium]